MDTYRPYSPPSKNNRRLFGFIFVVVLHLLLFYALQSGLAKTLVDKIAGPLETRVIEEMKAEAAPPPPPVVKLNAPPPVFVDMPDVAITEAPTQAAINPNAVAKAAPPPEVKKDIVVPPRTNPRRPNVGPEEIYPSMSKRLGEEGSVVLLLTVNAEGRVTEASIDTSSGFERLDEAASKEAVRSWRFLPGTVNGVASSMQTKIKVTFKITK